MHVHAHTQNWNLIKTTMHSDSVVTLSHNPRVSYILRKRLLSTRIGASTKPRELASSLPESKGSILYSLLTFLVHSYHQNSVLLSRPNVISS